MHPIPELGALLAGDRERRIERHRLERLAACLRACCAPSVIDRLARAVRLAPAAC